MQLNRVIINVKISLGAFYPDFHVQCKLGNISPLNIVYLYHNYLMNEHICSVALTDETKQMYL